MKSQPEPKKKRPAREKGPGLEVGRRVVRCRDVNGISQKELQRTCRLATGHLSHIESGHKPRLRRSTVVTIVEGLRLLGVEVTVDYILHGVGKPPRSVYSSRRAS